MTCMRVLTPSPWVMAIYRLSELPSTVYCLFALFLTGFSKGPIKHSGAQRFAKGQWCALDKPKFRKCSLCVGLLVINLACQSVKQKVRLAPQLVLVFSHTAWYCFSCSKLEFVPSSNFKWSWSLPKAKPFGSDRIKFRSGWGSELSFFGSSLPVMQEVRKLIGPAGMVLNLSDGGKLIEKGYNFSCICCRSLLTLPHGAVVSAWRCGLRKVSWFDKAQQTLWNCFEDIYKAATLCL